MIIHLNISDVEEINKPKYRYNNYLITNTNKQSGMEPGRTTKREVTVTIIALVLWAQRKNIIKL